VSTHVTKLEALVIIRYNRRCHSNCLKVAIQGTILTLNRNSALHLYPLMFFVLAYRLLPARICPRTGKQLRAFCKEGILAVFWVLWTGLL
jgi:hypothetical protein